MPNCFKLTRKGSFEPVSLIRVDEEICAHLDIEIDPDHYCCNWIETIGLGLACGKTFAELQEIFDSPKLKFIAKFLGNNFDVEVWAER